MAFDTLPADFSLAIEATNKLPRAPAAARILTQFDRSTLEGFIAVAIGVLDAIDGDPDNELNGDELDGTNAEDDFASRFRAGALSHVAVNDCEDAEDDDEDCDGFENEPLFDPKQCRRLNAFYGDGPGGGNLLDSDCEQEGY